MREEIRLIPTQDFHAYDKNEKTINFLDACVHSAFSDHANDSMNTINFGDAYKTTSLEVTLSHSKLPKYIPIYIIKRPKKIQYSNYYIVKCIYNDRVTFKVPASLVSHNSSTILIEQELNKFTSADKKLLSNLLDQFYHLLYNEKDKRTCFKLSRIKAIKRTH